MPDKARLRGLKQGFNLHNNNHISFLAMVMKTHLERPNGLPDEIWDEISKLNNEQIDQVTHVYSWLQECWDDDLIPGLINVDANQNGFINMNCPKLWELIIEEVRRNRY